MSVLSRVNWIAQQRLDLSHLLMSESFTAFDFRALIAMMTGSNSAFVIRGFEIDFWSSNIIEINVADSLIFNPQDGSGSFLYGQPGTPNFQLSLSLSATFYVEAVFTNSTENPVNTAFWNPLALNQDTAAGNEFTASTNAQNVLGLTIPTPSTTGFTPGAIPLYKIQLDASQIVSITDCRPLLFRLGTGGAIPDPSHKFNWSPNRTEPVFAGNGYDQQSTSPFMSQDNTGILNDKGIKTLKDWMDAVMTRIAEVTGSPIWYGTGVESNYIKGLNLNTVFFDSAGGHSLNPSLTTSLKWNANNTLTSEGTSPLDWQANYAGIVWRLGNTFANPGVNRQYGDVKFVSPVPADGGNLYLVFEKDVAITLQDNPVNWAPSAVPTCYAGLNSFIVTGSAGDFTGLAIGDYVRKGSEGMSQYARVVSFTKGDSGTEITTDQLIADNTVTAIRLSKTIAQASTEVIRMFRSNYSSADLVADTDQSQVDAGQYNYQDINNYWIGRRVGNLFMLRGYGAMQHGQEIVSLGPQEFATGFSGGGQGGGDSSSLRIVHALGASLHANAYQRVGESDGIISPGGSGATLLTIYRRKRNNEVPTGGDNSGALLSYTLIDNPVIPFANPGDVLWVKFSDTAGGTLAPGNVYTSSEDQTDVDTTANVYQVLSQGNTPLADFNNKDVVPIAWFDGTNLIFLDGSVLGSWCKLEVNNQEFARDIKVDNDVYLPQQPYTSVLWMDSFNRVFHDVNNFFWDPISQLHGIWNYRVGIDTLEAQVARDQTWFSNLGAHTLTIGGGNITVHIRGDIVWDGTSSAINEKNLVIEDKNIVLGMGNLVNSSGGSGFSVADGTISAVSIGTTNGQIYVDVTYGSAHGYVVGNAVTVITSETVGGITAGEIAQAYTVVSSGSTSGDAQVISPTVLRLWTNGSATSTATDVISGSGYLESALTLAYLQIGAADGSTSGYTSWNFQVKSLAQNVSLTPVSGFDVIPTAKSADFSTKRIPWATDDNAGPSGSDTTLDFSANLTWDNTINTHTIAGKSLVIGKPSVTANWASFQSTPNFAGSGSYTYMHFEADPLTVSGTAPTSVYGYYAGALVSGTAANYGFYGAVATSGTGATNWNLYMAGTARNYLAANLGIGQATYANITSRLTLGDTSDTTAAGGILFGQDTTLYRNAVASLKTDGNLVVGSAIQVKFGSTKTSTYQILATDCVVPFDTTGGTFTMTLPASTASNKGQVLYLKDVGGQEVFTGKFLTLAPSGTDTIDGVNANITVNFSTVTCITLISNGAGGWIVT